MRKIVDNISLVHNIPNGTSIDFVEKDFIKKHKDDASGRWQGDITLVVKVIND